MLYLCYASDSRTVLLGEERGQVLNDLHNIYICVCVCVCVCVGVCNNMQVQIHECFCVFVVCLAHHSVLLLDLQEEVGLEGQGVLEARPVLL